MKFSLRTRYDIETRASAVDLSEKGFGYQATASRLGIPRRAVEKWHSQYVALGREAVLQMGLKRRAYTFDQKLAVAVSVVDHGMMVTEAMALNGIASKSSAERWCKDYREGGADALRPKPKGRPKGSKAEQPKELTREQELEIQVRKLQVENAYLKNWLP